MPVGAGFIPARIGENKQMTEHKKLQPEIRFAGFTDDWEQRKLRDVIEKFEYGLNAQALPFDGLHKYIRITDIDDESRTFLLDNLTTPDVNFKRSQKYKLIKNDIVFARTGASVGKTYLYNQNDGELYFAGFLIRGNILQGFNAHFIFQITLNEQFKHFIQTTSQRSGQPGINAKEYSSFEFLCPSLEEQTQIGNFFKQLDDTIALHQRTLEKYQKLKISYLEKMFPKENELYPELRFPNFTDAWEQRKLEELADIRRGASPRPIQDEKWFDKNSKIGWLRISDVTEQNGRIHFIEQKLSFAGQEKTLVLNEPHLILSIAATIGKPVINYVPTGIHDGFIVFLNLKTDMEFLFQWLEIFRPQWQKLGQSGSQVNINSELVRDQIITLPKSKEEQTQIGNFFKQLDDTIALHQREVEKYKKIKQSYLEKMFI